MVSVVLVLDSFRFPVKMLSREVSGEICYNFF